MTLHSEATSPLVFAKTTYRKAVKVIEAAKLGVAQAFKLYGNLLSNEARQPWEKITKVQGTHVPWEDVYGVMYNETPTKTWSFFCVCITYHLQKVFRYNAGKTLKYYIANTLKKSN